MLLFDLRGWATLVLTGRRAAVSGASSNTFFGFIPPRRSMSIILPVCSLGFSSCFRSIARKPPSAIAFVADGLRWCCGAEAWWVCVHHSFPSGVPQGCVIMFMVTTI